MFKQARIKLTIYYVLIIMFIGAIFSVPVYFMTSSDLERGFRRAEMRFRAQELGLPIPRGWSENIPELPPNLSDNFNHLILVEDINQAKKDLILRLISLNGIILILSGFVAYFLAGKTLKPIEEAMEEQKRFISDASHELRTPLTVLKTSLEVALRDKNLNLTESIKVLKSNLQDVNSLQKLANNLLSLINNKQNQQSSLINIQEFISKALKKAQILANKKNIQLIDKSQSLEIKVIAEKFEELLTIILDNAIKYTHKKGKITISTKLNKHQVLIKIKDTGIGISKKDLPYVFDRFYRSEKSRTSDGFGLGLSIAKKIIEQQHGKIKVESHIGKGSVFTIVLPLNTTT